MSITDSINLIRQYPNELEWFFEEYASAHEQMKLLKELELIDILSNCNLIGTTKKNNDNFYKWKMNKRNELQDLINEKSLTVFEKIKKQSKKQETVFKRLKRMKKHGI